MAKVVSIVTIKLKKYDVIELVYSIIVLSVLIYISFHSFSFQTITYNMKYYNKPKIDQSYSIEDPSTKNPVFIKPYVKQVSKPIYASA